MQQDLPDLRRGTEVAATVNFAVDYVLNLIQAYMFRRYGFLTSIVVRVAFYRVKSGVRKAERERGGFGIGESLEGGRWALVRHLRSCASRSPRACHWDSHGH